MICFGEMQQQQIKAVSLFFRWLRNSQDKYPLSLLFWGEGDFTSHAWGFFTCLPIESTPSSHLLKHLSTATNHPRWLSFVHKLPTYFHLLTFPYLFSTNKPLKGYAWPYNFKIFRILWLSRSFGGQMVLAHSLKHICVHIPTSNFKLHPHFYPYRLYSQEELTPTTQSIFGNIDPMKWTNELWGVGYPEYNLVYGVVCVCCCVCVYEQSLCLERSLPSEKSCLWTSHKTGSLGQCFSNYL